MPLECWGKTESNKGLRTKSKHSETVKQSSPSRGIFFQWWPHSSAVPWAAHSDGKRLKALRKTWIIWPKSGKKEREKRHCGKSSVLMRCPLLNTEGLYSLLTNTWWNTDFMCADNKTIMAIHLLRGQKPQFYFTHCSNNIWINWVNFIHGVCDTVQCFSTMWFYCCV